MSKSTASKKTVKATASTKVKQATRKEERKNAFIGFGFLAAVGSAVAYAASTAYDAVSEVA